MLEGETILSGAPPECAECKTRLEMKVCLSGAGYFIGSECNCGPYSRESGYFASREEAQQELKGFEDAAEALRSGQALPLPRTARR